MPGSVFLYHFHNIHFFWCLASVQSERGRVLKLRRRGVSAFIVRLGRELTFPGIVIKHQGLKTLSGKSMLSYLCYLCNTFYS